MADHIEIMARAIAIADGEIFDGTMDANLSENQYCAKAAIKALEANGLAIVPVEPTEAMLDATRFSPAMKQIMAAKYKQMVRAAIAARPKP